MSTLATKGLQISTDAFVPRPDKIWTTTAESPYRGFGAQFTVREIVNGFIVEHYLPQTDSRAECYCQDMTAVGVRVTELCIALHAQYKP